MSEIDRSQSSKHLAFQEKSVILFGISVEKELLIRSELSRSKNYINTYCPFCKVKNETLDPCRGLWFGLEINIINIVCHLHPYSSRG